MALSWLQRVTKKIDNYSYQVVHSFFIGFEIIRVDLESLPFTVYSKSIRYINSMYIRTWIPF